MLRVLYLYLLQLLVVAVIVLELHVILLGRHQQINKMNRFSNCIDCRFRNNYLGDMEVREGSNIIYFFGLH